jgi:hypothetical protein
MQKSIRPVAALVIPTLGACALLVFMLARRTDPPPGAAVQTPAPMEREEGRGPVARPRLRTAALSAPTAAEKAPEEEAVEQQKQGAHAAVEELKTRLSAFSTIRRDQRWAGTTEKLFDGDFAGMALSTSAPPRVECRDDSCVAEVEWDSKEKGMREVTRLAHHGYAANCATSLIPGTLSHPMEESADGKSLKALLYLDCSSWKAGGSVPLVVAEHASDSTAR